MKHLCIDSYKAPDDIDDWEPCPTCGLRPRVWEFDNGRSTACGCGRNEYDHFSIHAESIMSVVKNSETGGDATNYHHDDLRKNWNTWSLTGKIIFEHASKRADDRW